jgi:uncharacterized lipoprotein YehR (DUF1307 family)
MNYKFITLKDNDCVYVIDILDNDIIKFSNSSSFDNLTEKLNSNISSLLLNYYKKNGKILKQDDGYYITFQDLENGFKIKTVKKVLDKWLEIYKNNIELFL